MNTIAAFLAVSAIFVVVSASGYGGASSGGSYGGAAMTIPAPPCPKNYLFSCQPNLSPAPCSQSHSSGGYGSSGAYSENVPTIVNAPYNGGYQGYPNFQQQIPHFQWQVGHSSNEA